MVFLFDKSPQHTILSIFSLNSVKYLGNGIVFLLHDLLEYLNLLLFLDILILAVQKGTLESLDLPPKIPDLLRLVYLLSILDVLLHLLNFLEASIHLVLVVLDNILPQLL